jgi:hypothetical protein
MQSCRLMLRITACLAGGLVLAGCMLTAVAVAAGLREPSMGRVAGGIFKWTDSRGGVHYSDRPPTAQDLEPPEPEPNGFEGGLDIASPVPSPSGPLSSAEASRSAEAANAQSGPSEGVTSAPMEGGATFDIAAGMTERRVQEVWGRPDRVRTLLTPEGFVERWIYEEGPSISQHIDFLRGRVVSVVGPDLTLQGAPLDLPTN